MLPSLLVSSNFRTRSYKPLITGVTRRQVLRIRLDDLLESSLIRGMHRAFYDGTMFRAESNRGVDHGVYPGHLFEKDRRLVDGLPHEDRARGRRPGDGAMEAQSIRGTRTTFRSRRPVEGDLVRQAP